MRTLGPLIVGIVAGWIAFGELFIANEHYGAAYELLRDFAQILTATAFILGGLNLAQVNFPKIQRRTEDWQYKVIMMASALIVGLAGIQWHTFGGERESGEMLLASAEKSPVAGKSLLIFEPTHPQALVVIGGKTARIMHTTAAPSPHNAWSLESAEGLQQAGVDGAPLDVWSPAGDTALRLLVEPGVTELSVRMPTSGYNDYKVKFKLQEGYAAVVDTDLVMRWGAGSPEGRVFTWFYDYIFYPCNATMFALLAFFIASAAFRAFRARNVESALLLGSAILVMIGLVPVGRLISPFFPELADWIVDFPNNAGRRAIMMGAALGAIVTGLRVILGLERSHLGSES